MLVSYYSLCLVCLLVSLFVKTARRRLARGATADIQGAAALAAGTGAPVARALEITDRDLLDDGDLVCGAFAKRSVLVTW